MRPYAELERAPGSLESYCDARLGQFVFVCEPWDRSLRAGAQLSSPASVEPLADVAGSASIVAELTAGLPRLACEPPKVERLRANVWLVDVSLRNAGALPTAVAQLVDAHPAARVRLRASGVEVVGIATARAGGDYEPLSNARDAWVLGHLAAQDGLSVRLVVEAVENAVLELVFDAPRAGEVRLSVPLL